MAHPSLDLFVRYVRKVTGARLGEGLADGQLLDRFVSAQDQAAFATLMERHGGIVWRVCQGMLHDPHDVEDAFQATFMVLVRRAGSLERRASLGGWLYGVAYRVALKAKTTAARRRLHERQAGAMIDTESSELGAENPDLRPALAEELNRLPEKYRTPIVLCYLEGKSNEEAARQLCCPVGTVWARLTRGRERLRGRLARRGLALSAVALTAALGPETASAAAAVPASLIDSTMKAAVLVATGQAVAGVISGQALALTEGVLHAMWIAKLRIAAALLIAVSLVVGTGAGIATHWASAGAAGTSAASAEAHWVIPPSLEGRRPFPPDNWWNQDIAKEPVDPNSEALIASIGAEKPLYPDFGRVHAGEARGLPYVIVSGNQPKVPVRFVNYPAESDPGPYPVPLDAPIEGGSIGTGNRHVIVVDRDNWKAYELLDAVREGEGWRASAGAVFDFTTNQLRPRGRTSADGAGLPIFPGLVRYDEVVEQKKIEHALRFTVRQTRRAYVAPARHWANEQTDPNLPPMGMRVRLRADYDISSFPPAAQVILTALKKYGMFVASHGEDWALSGAPDPRWNEDDLRTLERVQGRDFEVVRMGKTEP
jgi:RNA polymerase sigma factor (sigma-70 family)